MLRFRVTAAAVAVAAALLLTSCATGAATRADGRIGVVAAENFWGDIAKRIGGDRVAVTSIISDPNADPHEYEGSAVDAAALASARVVIENGLGYDDFMSKLLDAQPGSGRAVISVQRVLGITRSGTNPHLWYDTARIPAVAHAIEQRLAAAAPSHAAEFAANEQRFVASLRPITAVVQQIRAEYAGTRIAYTERVPGYLTSAAGLTLGMPAGFARSVEQGSDPSPQDETAFEDAIRSRSVKVLLYNAQVTDEQTTLIKRLAAESGVPVVGVTETMPPHDDYVSWQLRQAKQLLAALGR